MELSELSTYDEIEATAEQQPSKTPLLLVLQQQTVSVAKKEPSTITTGSNQLRYQTLTHYVMKGIPPCFLLENANPVPIE